MSKKLKSCWFSFIALIMLLAQLAVPPAFAAEANHNLALGKQVTASGYTDVYEASHVTDGNSSTYWESPNHAFPQWLQVDLGSTAELEQLVLKLPAGWEARTQTIEVSVSEDGTSYSTIVPSSAFIFQPTSGNLVALQLEAVAARYVKLSFASNTAWSAAQLSELEVYGSSVQQPEPSNVYQAEQASLSGGAKINNDHSGYNGSGFVDGYWNQGAATSFTVNAPAAGSYDAILRYGNATDGSRTLSLYVNGSKLKQTTLPNLASWSSWATVTEQITLQAGSNTIVFQYDAGDTGNVNLDQLALTPSVAPTATPTATPTASPTATPTPAPTATPTPTPTATPTTTPTATPTATPTTSPTATPPAGSNIALNKPITASSTVHTFIASNANDGSTTTYWEGGSSPSQLTVDLEAEYIISSVVVKLNPAQAWGARTQTIEVLGSSNNTAFSSLAAAQPYTFNPDTGNTITIPVSATVKQLRLNMLSNTGAPAGQVAELEIYGTPAPNPDLIISNVTWTPASPTETSDIVLHATVENIGSLGSPATEVSFYADNSLLGSAPVGALSVQSSQVVSLNIGSRHAGSYTISAIVDESKLVNEQNKSNNSFTSSSPLTVNPITSSDLVATAAWNPGSPSNGDQVSFIVHIKNQGNIASGAGPHQLSVSLKDSSGAVVQAWSGSYQGVLAAGATATVNIGSWTAVDGSYTVTTTVSIDSNEAELKQANNTSSTSLYAGRGANMPFTVLEAEASSNTTNGTILAPNFKPGDFAGEASGRSAVYLDAQGEYVEFTLTAPANAFVLRHAVAENTSGTISLYVDGVDKGSFNVSSKYAYVYATPSTLGQLGYNNDPGPGLTAYWLYEDAQLLLDQVYPAGTKIKIQKDAGDVPWIYVDMLETEHVAPAAQNPDPAKYVEVSATKSIEQALNEFRQDSTKKGIFIPAGEWEISNKIYLYGRATELIGAGPWHTKLVAPQNQTNTDVGFNIGSSANGSTIKDLSAWGNYVYRIDGPGKFIDGNGMQNVTVQNLWVEHFICLYWGVNSSYNTFKDNRIKNTFADGINMTNGSSYNVIDNNYSRGAGDDAFALFSAIDSGGSYNVGNQYINLTATCVRRAAAFAVYGGSGNLFQNLYAADTLTYPGITISSLSFGYNTLGFGDQDTVIDGATLDRTGGDFWTSVGADDKINEYQNFGAIWFYGGDRTFKNIVVKNIDINNPVYFGLMFQTKSPENLAMENVRVENVNINNPGRYGIKLVVRAEQGQGPARGEASFKNVKIHQPGVAPIYGEQGSPNFNIIRLEGNNW